MEAITVVVKIAVREAKSQSSSKCAILRAKFGGLLPSARPHPGSLESAKEAGRKKEGMRLTFCCTSFTLWALLVANPAHSQIGQAEILGTVTDASGAVLPGVAVTATQVDVGFKRTTVTNSRGRYTFTQLPVGRFEFVFELNGFSTSSIGPMELNLGERPTLNVTMQITGVTETILVEPVTPQVETTRSEISHTIQNIQIQELPVLGRDWLGFAILAPGIKSDGSEGSQDLAPTAGVGVGRQDKVIIDGADVNNRSTARGVDIKLSKEVIAEFEVKTNQFDAQLGQSGTSITQAVTRSGTDRFGGSAFFFFRDDALNAEDFFTGTKAEFRNEQLGGTLGGPIIRGKAHFFFGYEWQNTPQTLSSNTGITLIDEQQVDGDETRNLWFIRGDYQFNQNHRAAFRYNRSTQFQAHAGTGGRVPPGGSFDVDFWFNRYNFSLDSVLGTSWVNGFIFSVLDTNRLFRKRGDVVIGTELNPVLTTTGPAHQFPSARLGGGGGGFENPDYWAIRDDVSVFFEAGGQHNFKFGGYLERATLSGFGNFLTNGLFFYRQDPPNLQTCCVSENQDEWDKSQFPVALRFTQGLGDPTIEALPQNFYSGYIQDDWTLNERLTLNLGLRYDLETGSLMNDREDALLQSRFEIDKDNFQPRLGFAYDVKGDAQTVIRGGAGKYHSQAFLNIGLFVQNSNRSTFFRANVFNPTGDPAFNDDPLMGRGFEDFSNLIGNPANPLDVNILPPGSEIPSLWSFSIGVARQMTPSLAFQADYVHQRTDNQFRSVDTNLFFDAENNRALPVRSGFFPELGGQVEGSGRPDPRWNSILEIGNVGTARYHGLSLSLTQRFTDGLSFGVTYLLSKNQDDFDNFPELPSNMFDLEDEFGTSQHDQRHRFTANWVWQMPYNFVVSGLVFGASGRARPTLGNFDLFGDARLRLRQVRPTCGLDPQFDGACGVLGIPDGTRVPRNSFRSDSVFRVDIRFGWRAYLREDVFIEPSIEVFNLFNRENYDPLAFNTSLASSGFGSPGRSANLPYLPRQIQLGIMLRF